MLIVGQILELEVVAHTVMWDLMTGKMDLVLEISGTLKVETSQPLVVNQVLS
jgi:hypothetical protein